MAPRKIVGIYGKAGSGKSTFAKTLLGKVPSSQRKGWVRRSVASRLKRAVEVMFDLPEGRLSENAGKEATDPITGFTYGRILQIVGGAMRRDLRPDIWPQLLFSDPSIDGKNVLIDDIRFSEEIAVFREHDSTLVHLSRTDTTARDTHLAGQDAKDASETALDGRDDLFDYHFEPAEGDWSAFNAAALTVLASLC